MNQRQGTKNPAGSSRASRNVRLVAAVLAVYAVAVPLILSAILAPGVSAGFPPLLHTAALTIVMLGPGIAAVVMLLRGLDAIVRDLTERHDGEPRQIVIHALFHGIAFAYIAGAAFLGVTPDRLMPLLAVSLLGVLCGWLLFIHLMVQPEPSLARRSAAMVADIAFISAYLHIGDRLAAPWVSMYLWCSLGFGAYFGLRWLLAGAVLSLLSFAGVFATTPYWAERPEAAAGVAIALVLLPPCAANLVRRLAAAKALVEEAKDAKSRFLSIMSQELRVPVNELIGTGAALGRSALDGEQRSLLTRIQISTRALLGLINDILDFSNMGAGKFRWDVEGFSLHEVLGGTIMLLRPQAGAKGLALSLRIDPRLPHAYRGLPQHLRHVLTSLVGNAIRCTPRGRVDVSARLIERLGDTVRLRLAVRDDAIGVAYRPPHANAGDEFFDITVEAEGAVTRRHGGLGLVVAKQLTESMGGTLQIESELGKGSSFIVDLALPIDAAGASRAPDLAGRDAFVVTADADLAALLEEWLGGWRGEVKRFADGDAAARHLAGAPRSSLRALLLIDGRDDPLAGLSIAHRLTAATGRAPLVLFIAPQAGADSIAGLAAAQLAAVVEAPISDAALANALLAALAGDVAEAEAAEPSPSAEIEPTPSAMAPFAASRPLRVLVAEDSEANRKILKRILDLAGHEAVIVDDGEAALSILDRERFDLALLDIDMPEMGGREVTKLYRMEHLGEARLPIIALAAEATSETERQCQEAGMDSIVTKPVEAAQLLAAIDEIYERVAAPVGAAMASPIVTPISSHPRFFSDAGAIVDEATIDALRMLGGGSDFLRDIIESFCNDGRRLLQRLREAAAEGDLHAFKELTHSLRSGAANVGAARLCQVLATLKDITTNDLRQHGPGYVDKLQGEFTKLESVLDRMAKESRSG